MYMQWKTRTLQYAYATTNQHPTASFHDEAFNKIFDTGSDPAFERCRGVIAIYTTPTAMGYSDPMVYISTARSLDRGQGLVYYEADAAFRRSR